MRAALAPTTGAKRAFNLVAPPGGKQHGCGQAPGFTRGRVATRLGQRGQVAHPAPLVHVVRAVDPQQLTAQGVPSAPRPTPSSATPTTERVAAVDGHVFSQGHTHMGMVVLYRQRRHTQALRQLQRDTGAVKVRVQVMCHGLNGATGKGYQCFNRRV